jgi:hypothetical protein
LLYVYIMFGWYPHHTCRLAKVVLTQEPAWVDPDKNATVPSQAPLEYTEYVTMEPEHDASSDQPRGNDDKQPGDELTS